MLIESTSSVITFFQELFRQVVIGVGKAVIKKIWRRVTARAEVKKLKTGTCSDEFALALIKDLMAYANDLRNLGRDMLFKEDRLNNTDKADLVAKARHFDSQYIIYRNIYKFVVKNGRIVWVTEESSKLSGGIEMRVLELLRTFEFEVLPANCDGNDDAIRERDRANARMKLSIMVEGIICTLAELSISVSDAHQFPWMPGPLALPNFGRIALPVISRNR